MTIFPSDLDGNQVRTRSGCLSKFGETYYRYGFDAVDVREKLVAELVNGFKHAGNHETTLPRALNRGMYLILFAAGS